MSVPAGQWVYLWDPSQRTRRNLIESLGGPEYQGSGRKQPKGLRSKVLIRVGISKAPLEVPRREIAYPGISPSRET